MYTVGVICLGCCYGGLHPWQTSIVLVYFQNKQSVSTGHTIILKDMCIIWPFDSFLLSLVVIYNTFLKHTFIYKLQ